eukprot:gene15203-13178_t
MGIDSAGTARNDGGAVMLMRVESNTTIVRSDLS